MINNIFSTISTMAYQHDIFISYRRQELTLEWINNQFIPLLKHHIFDELGRDPQFYVDTQLESGTTWPVSLGSALGASRTIIPLWTKAFPKSKWCSCELGHMLEREKRSGFRTHDKPSGLVFPTIIHDGEKLPIAIATIQKTEIQECYNVRMSKYSPKAEILDDLLKPLGKAIADAINNAPDWKQDWQIEAENSFMQQFYIKDDESTQGQLPKF